MLSEAGTGLCVLPLATNSEKRDSSAAWLYGLGFATSLCEPAGYPRGGLHVGGLPCTSGRLSSRIAGMLDAAMKTRLVRERATLSRLESDQLYTINCIMCR